MRINTIVPFQRSIKQKHNNPLMNTISIIGAGIGGLTLGNILKQYEYDFTIYESAPEIKPVGAGIMMAVNAMQVFDRLGLKEKLKMLEIKFTGSAWPMNQCGYFQKQKSWIWKLSTIRAILPFIELNFREYLLKICIKTPLNWRTLYKRLGKKKIIF